MVVFVIFKIYVRNFVINFDTDTRAVFKQPFVFLVTYKLAQ